MIVPEIKTFSKTVYAKNVWWS